jgi:hypothetical protein
MTAVHHRRGGEVRSRARVLAIGCLVALGAWAFAAPSAGLSSPPVPRCVSSQLTLKFVSFQGATGHRFWQLAFKNLGSTCSMHGFPRVVLLNGAGHVIPATVKHEAGTVPTVSVAHGNRGHFPSRSSRSCWSSRARCGP